jgi:hypothetical protein
MLSLPPNEYVLIPRTWKEAHNRPDSLCSVLGIPFTELGPLLFTADILVKSNAYGRLSFSQDGFDTLTNIYKRTESSKLCVEKRKPAPSAWTADQLVDRGQPPYFFYVIRGSRKPSAYEYIPLCPVDVVGPVIIKDHSQEKYRKARDLGRELHQSFDSETAALFAESRQPTTTQSFTSTPVIVDTSQNSDAPNLITPDHGTECPSNWLSMQNISEMLYEGLDQVCGTSFLASSEHSEASETGAQCSVPSFPATIADEIDLSRQLNFDNRINNQRPPRHPNFGTPIDVIDRKQATALMRTKIIWLAEQWDYRQAPTKKEKLEIAEMASRVVFYDAGCPNPPKGSMVADWITELDNARFNNSTNMDQALMNEQLGSRQGTYTDRIEMANPGYLHELYRLVGKSQVSYRGNFADMATEMNRLSENKEPRPKLYLTKYHLERWFRANNGKVKKDWERPILTKDRMLKRVEWCRARKEEIESADRKYYYCFLDEKWFYVRSRYVVFTGACPFASQAVSHTDLFVLVCAYIGERN